ncbi:hypothetical protein [Rahnella perminowiae]|uniref:hypothetical protein n=1 Tax=Rahnella perminowiae TaxID=2816244 RepID=UPI00215BF71C|nr:hypothetical protein [Rahnella perminowiae]MCR9003110.1 hypothetical protein [Rahnella perminowiae]
MRWPVTFCCTDAIFVPVQSTIAFQVLISVGGNLPNFSLGNVTADFWNRTSVFAAYSLEACESRRSGSSSSVYRVDASNGFQGAPLTRPGSDCASTDAYHKMSLWLKLVTTSLPAVLKRFQHSTVSPGYKLAGLRTSGAKEFAGIVVVA